MDNFLDVPWRVGSKVGRTIYAVTDAPEDYISMGCTGPKNDILIGVMDTREIAAHVIAVHNLALMFDSPGVVINDGN